MLIYLMLLALLSCKYTNDTQFGKQYNAIRMEYGSPVIHDYMRLRIADTDFENWRAPQTMHDTISIGFHAGKGFYIHHDSILQEDDIFRKRINDSTFVFIAILTHGNLKKHQFTNIYYDTVDERSLKLTAKEYLNNNSDYKNYYNSERQNLTIEEADSILTEWGTGRCL
ncbi:hypothetical protein [Fulvivirga sediminis]|uniref:Uncharacterized protein n=1 Tax=Fulvivirga sediminis TaxID=2803949 RepID=A0A937K1Z0_9BACT|nr:hypothetical protein [Fulvivirga sediminis]MBL3657222.1 hypothetical protein [Fulvivirga sediminis]